MRNYHNSVTTRISDSSYISIVPVASHTFHIRVNDTGRFEAPSPLTRLGIVASPSSPVRWHTEESGNILKIVAEEAVLHLDCLSGNLALHDNAENVLARQTKPAYGGGADGFGAQFAISTDERLYGLGDQYDAPLMKRGRIISVSLRGNRVHAPIPLLLSSNGWALLVDTDVEHEFDVGHYTADELRFYGKSGELAYYLIAGGNLAELLGKHAQLTGPSVLLPIWAYGLSFICNQQTTARDMIEDALKFRREGIPCDMIGLEPTWMDRPFDYEEPVSWHPDRFYIPRWMPEGSHTFMGALQTMGFKLSLGLNMPDYPLVGTETAADSLSWYEYLKPFVAQEVKGFKLCMNVPVHERTVHPAHQEDGQLTVLPQAGLLSKIIQEGYAKQTGKRPIVYTPAGFTGVHKYAAMWSGGRARPHLSVLSLGLSGVPHMGVDMNLHNPAGIHFGFFQPWSKVNSWAYWRHPLLLDVDLLAVFKMYAKLRYRLIPYIYSAAEVAVRTGLPIVRAMPLAYPDDADAVLLENQYMFGDDFLVAVFTDQVYLPDGEWIDYWTGDKYAGPAHISYQAAAPAGGPLFVRAGAIVPMWPGMDYVGQKPLDRVELHLFPGRDRQYSLYEDDGVSLDYLRNESAVTDINCRQERHGIVMEIGPRRGRFLNMKEQRSWDLFIHTRDKPSAVKVNGDEWREASGVRKEPAPSSWSFHRRSGLIRLLIKEQAANPPSSVRLELLYAVEREARRAEPQSPQFVKYVSSPRNMPGELEKEIEIGIETGDAAKALSALEHWWSARTAGGHSPEDIREHWLYMYGLFVRSLERKGRTLSEALGEEYLHRFTLDPTGDAGEAFASLSLMAKLIMEYDAKHRGRTNEIVRRAADIIMHEIDQELSLHEVADRLHLNSSYLSRKFKKEIGVSFSDYVLEKKMELAKELLLNGFAVNATADRTGFKDASYFIRVFRKYWGITPGEMKP